jgi:DNA-3-methyladenine glycosylase II
VLARIIQACGPIHLVSRGDAFQSLARAIVGQQISVKAAQTIWGRFEKAAGETTPERVCRMRPATLQRAGLSQRKVEYLKDLAARFRSGDG